MILSIVVPLYRCEDTIKSLIKRVDIAMSNLVIENRIEIEFILVDDRSPLDDWKTVSELANVDSRIKGIRLSRNFGQHPAIIAGLMNSRGDWVVVMDGDLQDRPEEIPKLLLKALDGWDGVVARRVNRKDTLLKKATSWIYSQVLYNLTGFRRDSRISNFGIYNRKIISAILSVGDYIKLFPILINWVGFDVIAIDVEHGERTLGSSSYTLRKAFNLAVNSLITFSDKPLKVTLKIGFAIAAISLATALFYFIGAIFGGYAVQGWASLIISLWFLGGCQILFLGVVGLYIGKAFNQTKNRPVFIISEVIGAHETEDS